MQTLRPAFLLLFLFTILCGGLYPAAVTGLAQLLFPHQAGGSLISDHHGRVVGSELIGQPFSDPAYLWTRPSASGEFAYNPMASGGSNAGPTNPAYVATVTKRVLDLRAAGIIGPVPADLAQASASGLDPHITPLAASLQIKRIADARGISAEEVASLVTAHTEPRQFGFMGAPRVNVLAVNLDLEANGQ
jgi:K+-transporting ATPase ATPase C chain